jgi:hypothetical protein
MPLTRSFSELVERLAASDPDFEAALRQEGRDRTMSGEEGREGIPMTLARQALLAFAKAWTYPILGNEDVPVTDRLFEQARTLAATAIAGAADPSEFAGWLEILRNEPKKGSLVEWEDTLHAVTDYFGLSTDG